MPYNSKIHHRRSIRLKGYNYSRAGAYFITICCQDRECRFGKIVVGASLAGAQNAEEQMELNEYGKIAYDEWLKLPDRFSNFELDVFQIMPNHMHGIIVLNNVVVNGQPQINGQPQGIAPTVNATVGNIVGAYKSLVANACLERFKTKNETMGKLWQRNYHEHIIRNEQSYQTISNYIIINPAKWNNDNFYKQ